MHHNPYKTTVSFLLALADESTSRSVEELSVGGLPEVELHEEVHVVAVASEEADVVASVSLHHPAKISTRSSTRTSKLAKKRKSPLLLH